MKTLKKFTAFLLAVVMMFSLSANVLAAGAENLPFEDSSFFETGDYSIHYRVWEAENEKAKILMIHGFALSTYCWENLAEILVENGYTCVLADLPDFGYSSRETAQTEKLPREDIMYNLIQSLGGGEWYVAGHSMGGYVALALQQKYPDTVKNVLLYGTSGNEGTPDFLTSIMTNELFISVMGPLMQLMVRMTIFVKLFLAVSLSDNEYAENYDLSAITAPLSIDGTGTGALYSFASLTPTDFEALKNSSPVLFMNGDKDMVITDSTKNKTRDYLPEGSIDYIVVGGGHMFIENRAEEAAAVTLEFLANNP